MRSHFHTDIKSNGFIDRFFPASIIPYMKLGRFDRPVGVWLTVLPGFWALTLAAQGQLPLRYLILFVIGGFAIRAAGCVINDLWDRNLDKQVARTAVRPIASGQISVLQALAFLFFLLIIGLSILVQLPFKAIIAGCLAIIPIAIYPLMKRITFWPQLFLGLVFNFSILIGWLCVQPSLSANALLLYIAAIFLTVGYDTIYAFQDIEDDLKAGIKSTAIKFQKHPKFFVSLCYLFGFILLAIASQTWLVLFGGAHLIWQIYAWQPSDRPNSLMIFKSHVFFQFMIWLGFILQGI